jgi:hypothetical protein
LKWPRKVQGKQTTKANNITLDCIMNGRLGLQRRPLFREPSAFSNIQVAGLENQSI